jgi:hypothetical protein
MSPALSVAVMIATLIGVHTYLAASLLPIPVRESSIAWTSCGGVVGPVRSAASDWVGAVIASPGSWRSRPRHSSRPPRSGLAADP